MTPRPDDPVDSNCYRGPKSEEILASLGPMEPARSAFGKNGGLVVMPDLVVVGVRGSQGQPGIGAGLFSRLRHYRCGLRKIHGRKLLGVLRTTVNLALIPERTCDMETLFRSFGFDSAEVPMEPIARPVSYALFLRGLYFAGIAGRFQSG